jgi:hypothetical protein
MQTDYNKRFKQVIEILKKDNSITEKKVGEKIGLKAAGINGIKIGRSKLASRSAELLLEKEFNIDLDWLHTGEGTLYIDDNPSIHKNFNEPGEALICQKCNFGAYTKDFKKENCPECGENLLRNCPRCGENLIIPDQRFCHKCGLQFKK